MEQAQAHIFITDLLRLMKSRNGSDLLLSEDFPPAMKVDGRLMKLSSHALTEQHTIELARALMNDRQRADFERCKEANFAISPTDLGRYRLTSSRP
jgi:twitching motility protein PilU